MYPILHITALSLEDLDFPEILPSSSSIHYFLTNHKDICQAGSPGERLQWLSPQELARLNRITHAASRERFLVGRSFIRFVLSHYLKIPPGSIRIDTSANGKPSQNHDDQLFFNLSHTGNQFALAISKLGIVGIDIEQHKPRMHLFPIAQSILTDSDKKWFNPLTQAEQTKIFYQLWSLKEAILKAEGVGLNLAMNKIGFTRALSVSEWPEELCTPHKWCWRSLQKPQLSLSIALKKWQSPPARPGPVAPEGITLTP